MDGGLIVLVSLEKRRNEKGERQTHIIPFLKRGVLNSR